MDSTTATTVTTTDTMTTQELLEIRDRIAHSIRHNHTSNPKMFLGNWFAEEKRGHPVYVMRFELGENQFGNLIGIYLNEFACATQAHSHIVVIPVGFNKDFKDEPGHGDSFMKSLSTVYVHPNPADSADKAIELYQRKCLCLLSCWEHSSPSWLKFIPEIRDILGRALSAESFASHINSGTEHFIEGKISELAVGENVTVMGREIRGTTGRLVEAVSASFMLPLIPTVAIQFRCSDNFQHVMGLTPLVAIFDRLDDLGLADNHTIYIATEHPKRLRSKHLENLCPYLVNFIQTELAQRYPNVLVSIRRGHILETWRQFNEARFVFCSASTFCIWPAIANRKGVVYYPRTRILGSGLWHLNRHKYNVTNVHLIGDYDLVSITESSNVSELQRDLLFKEKLKVGISLKSLPSVSSTSPRKLQVNEIRLSLSSGSTVDSAIAGILVLIVIFIAMFSKGRI